MELTKNEERDVIAVVSAQLTERAWAKLEDKLEEVTCISIARLAGMLDLSTAQTRRVLTETIDFGPRDARVSIAAAKRLVEARKVKR